MATLPPNYSDTDSLEIVKDPRFFRTVADTVIVAPRGVETELCFIAVGPDPVEQFSKPTGDDKFDPGPIRLRASLSDVGHVRVDAIAAADLALNLISSLIERQIVTVNELMENIKKITVQDNKQSALDEGADR